MFERGFIYVMPEFFLNRK